MAFEDWSFIVSIKDIINFRRFKKDMQWQASIRDSKFNRYKLNLNWIGNVVYYQLNCTEEDLQHFDFHSDIMIMYKMQPVINYMNELGWSEYLIPQVNNFIDEQGNTSLSYGIMLVFTPFKFRLYKLITWPLIFGGIGFGIFELIKYLNM